MSKDPCGACGTPKRTNHYGRLDCYHCYPENFFGFTTVKPTVRTEDSRNIVDNPVFEDQGIEILAPTEET